MASTHERWINHINAVFLLKSEGPPEYYLGNDYSWSEEENVWVVGCATYIKECLQQIEEDSMIDGKPYEHKNPYHQNVIQKWIHLPFLVTMASNYIKH